MNDVFEISMAPFTRAAKMVVEDYTKVSINQLADGYCEAVDICDEFLKDGYMAALILRFWSKIGKLKSEHPFLFPTYSDASDAVVDSILKACEPKYRIWQRSSVNAETAINQVIYTRHVVNGYTRLGYQKNGGLKRVEEGGGGGVEFVSLDAVISEDNDETVGDKIPEEVSSFNDIGAHGVIQSLINNDKLVEAIIIDMVINRDVFKTETKKVERDGKIREITSTKLWDNRLVRELNSLDKAYLDNFLKEYNVPKNVFTIAFNDIVKASNPKKHKMIEKCQEFLRRNVDAYI